MGKYFSIKELCKSETAKRLGLNNEPGESVISNLNYLIEKVLDPLREWYGKPIYINSGYRSVGLNAKVGGVPNSFHLSGYAADIDMGDRSDNLPIFEYIKNNLPFTELGWEGNGKWVHVAIVKGRENEKQIFSA